MIHSLLRRGLLLLLAGTCTVAAQTTFTRSQQSIDDSSLLSEAYVTVGNKQNRLWEYAKGSSTNNSDKLYRSASAIKWVTSMVTLRLVNEGTMSLDDTPGKYLSYWAPDDDTVTLRQLLSFTSGFRGRPLTVPCVYNPFSNIDDCAETVYSSNLLIDDPGTTYFYGPCHMLIAASMAQKATGQPWQEIFDTRLGTILGMSSTLFTDSPNVSGGANFSGNDMDVFLRTMLQRDPNFLSTELWNEMLSDQTATVSFTFKPSFEYPFHYGLGVWRECVAETFDASCEPVSVVSTTGATGVSGWVDYNNEMYGLIMTDLGGLAGGTDVLSYAIEDLRPKILADLSGAPPTPAPTPSPVRCFAGTNSVIVQDRGNVAMEDLKIGDMIQTRDGMFERVYSFGHYDRSTVVDYLQLHLSNRNQPLEITSDHLVFVRQQGSSATKAIPASTVRVGDVMVSSALNAKDDTDSVRVEKIGTVTRRGYYAPFTSSGILGVNGILASNYVTLQRRSDVLTIGGLSTPISSHWFAHMVLTPYRMLCELSWTRHLCENEAYSRSGTSKLLDHPLRTAEWLMASED